MNPKTIMPITFPARPINGGKLELAPTKRGVWFAEPKYNGWRVLAHAPTGICFNRHGNLLTIAHEFATAMALLRHHGEMTEIEWFDCEGLERRHAIGRGTLVVLDAIIPGTYIQRRKRLLAAFPLPLPIECRPPENTVMLTPSFPASDAVATYENLRTINREWGCDFYEGLVMKRGEADYPIQRRSATEEWGAWCKHRFIT